MFGIRPSLCLCEASERRPTISTTRLTRTDTTRAADQTISTTNIYLSMAVPGCHSSTPIPRVSGLSEKEFHDSYFLSATPVIITDATEDWPARDWTIPDLVQRVGDNEVWVRGKTNQEDYRVGKTYTIRRDTFSSYCQDLLKANARARSSYLAVASMQQAFPQLLDDVPLPKYLQDYGKLHLGPYMWVALQGHYEFCHFDPDDNFLIMIQGRKILF